jgi:aldehyde dehydrogenase (NAD+)
LFAPWWARVAAGNCVFVKPSELAPHTEAVTLRILAEAFDPRHVAAVSGGPEIAGELLKQRFDKFSSPAAPPWARSCCAPPPNT